MIISIIIWYLIAIVNNYTFLLIIIHRGKYYDFIKDSKLKLEGSIKLTVRE